MESLQFHCIARLEKTWTKLAAPVMRIFTNLKAFASPANVFESYRAALLKASPPLIPWFDPLFQQSLCIKQLSPSAESGNFIPWERCSQLYDLVSSNLQGQNIPFAFQQEPTIHAYLSIAGNDLTEENLDSWSFSCEPE